MIKTRKDLKSYLTQDDNRFGSRVPGIFQRLLCNESWYIWKYKHLLRFLEYHLNNTNNKSKIKNSFHRLCYYYYFLRFRRLSWKLKCTIYPNTIGPGFHIFHIGGYIHIGPENKIGSECTLLPGVVLTAINKERQIGDNVTFGLNCKIMGKALNIGNNVTIGANAVVTHDLPSNVVAVGVPAKIIKCGD